MGHLRLREIERTHIFELQRRCLEEGLAPATVNKTVNSLRALLRDADAEGLLPSAHRMHLIAPLKALREPKNPTFAPWTLAERDALIECYRETEPAYAAMVEVLVFTGMRPEELLGLRPRCMSWREKCVRIQEARVDAGSRAEITPCKTDGSQREIPLNSLAIAAFQRLGTVPPGELWVRGPMGPPLDWHNFSHRVHPRVLKRLDGTVTRRPPYAFRHTFICDVLTSGQMDEQAVAIYCGTSARAIKKHYARYTRAWMERLRSIERAVTAPTLAPPEPTPPSRGHMRLVR